MRKLIDIEVEISKRMKGAVSNGLIKRAITEEVGRYGGISRSEPLIRKGESETYFHVRSLFHRVLGVYFKTPQYNLELWTWYLENYWPGRIKVYGKNFSAGSEKNLRFTTSEGNLDFNAHQAVDSDRFLGRFGLRNKVERLTLED